MIPTKRDVLTAFFVSGSSIDINYQRYTSAVPNITMLVSSSANNFTIKAIPSSSVGILFYRKDGTLINESSPLILNRTNSASYIDVSVDDTEFDYITEPYKEFPIKFKLVAVIPKLVEIPPTDDPPPLPNPNDCAEMGKECTNDVDCCSGECYNPQHLPLGGICTALPGGGDPQDPPDDGGPTGTTVGAPTPPPPPGSEPTRRGTPVEVT